MKFSLIAALALTACLGLSGPCPVWAGGLEQASLGLTALGAGEYARAVTLLTQAIDSNELPESEAYLFLAARGYARAAAGDHKDAIEDYDACLVLMPDHAPALFNRGNARYALGQYDLAIGDYSKVLELHAGDVGALNNRGAAWFHKGNLQSALANYTQAAQVAPDDVDVLLNRGKVYDALGETDLAREDFLRIKRIDPSARTPLD